MKNQNYPLVTMTIEQYETLNERSKQFDITNKAFACVMECFTTDDDQAKLLDYIESNKDKNISFDREIKQFIESKIKQITGLKKFSSIKNIKVDLPEFTNISPAIQTLTQNNLNDFQNIFKK
ncbi:hypothetical protein V7266_27445 [Neobacillus drentensis]|uniref:hypothetical protein n=1 Tax=Neobacillus drentensis TaxID=220684 RepID=UPI002FFDD19B